MKISWLQNYLIPCPFKKLTGFDCPGCGFQRSVIELFSGDFKASMLLYPAAMPIILIVLLAFFGKRFKLNKIPHLKKLLYIFTAAVVAASYLVKLSHYL